MVEKIKVKWGNNRFTIIIISLFLLIGIGDLAEKNKLTLIIMISCLIIYSILIVDGFLLFDKGHKIFSTFYIVLLIYFIFKYITSGIEVLDKTFIDEHTRSYLIGNVNEIFYYAGLLALLRPICIQFINYIKSAYEPKDVERN